MITVLTLALPFAVAFMTISGQLTWQGFVVGYIVSFLVLRVGQANNLNVNPVRAPFQLVYLFVYAIRLAWDIFVSSIGVARMVLSPDMDSQIAPAILVIPTQDPENNEIITALSSHGITITPGQLVVDITLDDDETMLHVHNLNVETSRPTIEQDQTKRLQLIRRILGYGQ